jgi:predicted RNA-binding protein YlqC (UPF0109 family)
MQYACETPLDARYVLLNTYTMLSDSSTTPTQAKTAEEFLYFVLESLVEDKDQLKISVMKDDLGTLCTVQVSNRDMGKLIGKHGQTVKALRTLLRVLGGMRNERLNLKILEPVE